VNNTLVILTYESNRSRKNPTVIVQGNNYKLSVGLEKVLSCWKEVFYILRKAVLIKALRFLVSSFSIEKVSKIVSPVLVIHGTEDEVIDFSHGLAIYERCPRTVDPLWVEGAGHNDVELYGQYLERLKQFIQHELVTN